MRGLEARSIQPMGSKEAAFSKAQLKKTAAAGVAGGVVEMSRKYLEQRGKIEPTVPKEKGVIAKVKREGEIFSRTKRGELAKAFVKGAAKGVVEEVIFETAKKEPGQVEEDLYEMAA
ncbi:hypothetical protein C4559_01535 [Candidatus Microgenomates bacterium]|nr:MAG: hypothetical protein C4559_01535 [Candidatus Microgenomates bacterium]